MVVIISGLLPRGFMLPTLVPARQQRNAIERIRSLFRGQL